MTDNLTTKFSGFEDLVTANHTALMDLLNSIAETIGAPPTGPTTTLADVVTALTQTNTILAGIRSDMADQSAALLSVTNSLYANSELMLENSSTNTQALLAALYATFCDCATEAPPLAPPTDVTPTPLEDDEKCRRVQFYISVFTSWLTKLANYTATGASLTSGVIDSLLSLAAAEAGIVATGAEVGTVGGIPGVVLLSAVALIAGAVYLIGSAVLNDYLTNFQSPIFQHALLEAMYAADNASEGQSAFESTVGTYFATVPAGILSALWWSQWSNDMYSDTPVVDTSAFDGTICKPDLGEITDCTSFTSQSYALSGVGTFEVIISPPIYGGNEIFTAGNFQGYSVRVLSNPDAIDIRIDFYNASDGYNSGTIINAVDSTATYGDITTAIGIHSDSPTGSIFTIELCPPA